ncbi:hypothetical protein AB0L71_20515 [Streptomyces sp. NPDC052052]|uniref:hypothetical protein n=1 Tax=Streptomyces sp. NPDC052052 TaxID=3154756 RepID=UPI0034280B33
MTDKQVGVFLLSGLASFLFILMWKDGYEPLAIIFGISAAVGIHGYIEDAEEGPKRPVLTIATEIAGVVGGVLAVIEFVRK